jgi:alpha-L-arabinofuranosidase
MKLMAAMHPGFIRLPGGNYVEGDTFPTRFDWKKMIGPAEPVPHGAVGVGTWETSSQYKDIRVTAPDGKILLQADLGKDASGWKASGGQWTTQDAAIRPATENSTGFATIGDTGWTDYTFTCKARKISGREGFMLLFHVHDADNYVWWNVGGWGNTQCGFEGTDEGNRDPFGSKIDLSVDENRWYDLKVEVEGHHFRAYLDGKLINDATEDAAPGRVPVFAQASYIKASGEVVLKLVNASSETVDAAINLRGAGEVSPAGRAILLSGTAPTDVNTVQQLTRIAPQETAISDASASFHRSVPPFSVSVLRLKAVRQ